MPSTPITPKLIKAVILDFFSAQFDIVYNPTDILNGSLYNELFLIFSSINVPAYCNPYNNSSSFSDHPCHRQLTRHAF